MSEYSELSTKEKVEHNSQLTVCSGILGTFIIICFLLFIYAITTNKL